MLTSDSDRPPLPTPHSPLTSHLSPLTPRKVVYYREYSGTVQYTTVQYIHRKLS